MRLITPHGIGDFVDEDETNPKRVVVRLDRRPLIALDPLGGALVFVERKSVYPFSDFAVAEIVKSGHEDDVGYTISPRSRIEFVSSWEEAEVRLTRFQGSEDEGIFIFNLERGSFECNYPRGFAGNILSTELWINRWNTFQDLSGQPPEAIKRSTERHRYIKRAEEGGICVTMFLNVRWKQILWFYIAIQAGITFERNWTP